MDDFTVGRTTGAAVVSDTKYNELQTTDRKFYNPACPKPITKNKRHLSTR